MARDPIRWQLGPAAIEERDLVRVLLPSAEDGLEARGLALAALLPRHAEVHAERIAVPLADFDDGFELTGFRAVGVEPVARGVPLAFDLTHEVHGFRADVAHAAARLKLEFRRELAHELPLELGISLHRGRLASARDAFAREVEFHRVVVELPERRIAVDDVGQDREARLALRPLIALQAQLHARRDFDRLRQTQARHPDRDFLAQAREDRAGEESFFRRRKIRSRSLDPGSFLGRQEDRLHELQRVPAEHDPVRKGFGDLGIADAAEPVAFALVGALVLEQQARARNGDGFFVQVNRLVGTERGEKGFQAFAVERLTPVGRERLVGREVFFGRHDLGTRNAARAHARKVGHELPREGLAGSTLERHRALEAQSFRGAQEAVMETRERGRSRSARGRARGGSLRAFLQVPFLQGDDGRGDVRAGVLGAFAVAVPLRLRRPERDLGAHEQAGDLETHDAFVVVLRKDPERGRSPRQRHALRPSAGRRVLLNGFEKIGDDARRITHGVKRLRKTDLTERGKGR